MLNINDLYMVANGITDQNNSHPWDNNWNDWDGLVQVLAQSAVANNLQIDWWDVWNEPDNYWHGTYAQYIECFRRTDSILHLYIPDAKISGPEFAFGSSPGDFQITALLNFLDSLQLTGSQVEGLSWHEFFQPESVLAHVQEIRDSLVNRPWASGIQLQVTEYGGLGTHQIPGWNVGWLYYFELSSIDWATHACWNETDNTNTWSDCQFGMNSLFMPDHSTPQPNYWVHNAYSMLDSNRMVSNSSHENVLGIGSLFFSNQEMRLLLGYYNSPVLGSQNASTNLNITIRNYPFCSNCSMPITIQRIPANTVGYSIGLTNPQTIYNGNINISGDSIQISIPSYVDGDAYYVVVNPSEHGVLSIQNSVDNLTQLSVFPNPTDDKFEIHSSSPMGALYLYNLSGNMVKTVSLNNSYTQSISIDELHQGFYVFKIVFQNGEVAVRKILVN
jgi:hypothetical protein